jgi:AGZA family xanthine/uracil permease-like MFS transporter
VALMPFTYSIANGITVGIVSYAAIKVLTGRPREVHPVLYVVAVLLCLSYALGHAA